MTGLCLYVTVTLAAPLVTNRARPIVIGSKTFTEQYVLSSILSQWIEQETNRPTVLMQSLGSIVAEDLASGDLGSYDAIVVGARRR